VQVEVLEKQLQHVLLLMDLQLRFLQEMAMHFMKYKRK
jgi:hypothetical protein